MTTFPQDLRIQFDNDIHVIFGGNHSGKTTIVNSLKYGVFGLSSSNLPEGVEKRYFVSRIKEIERKSLDISAVCITNQKSIATNRKVFSSGTAEIYSIISDDTGLFSKSPRNLEREKEYDEALKGELGNLSNDEKDFVSELMFADENRKPILWGKNLKTHVYRLLSSLEKRSELQEIENQFLEMDNKFNRIRQNLSQKESKHSDNKRYLNFLEQRIEDLDEIKLDKSEKDLGAIKTELDECRKAITKTSEALESELVHRQDFNNEAKKSENAISELTKKLDILKGDYLGAFFKEATSDIYHVGKYVYHNGQCPICFANIASEVKNNLDSKKCPLCGKSDLVNVGNMTEIEQIMTKIEAEKENIESVHKSIEQKFAISQQEIERLNLILGEKHALEASLLLKLDTLKSIDEELLSRKLLKNQIQQLSKTIAEEEQEIREIKQEIDSINLEMSEVKNQKSEKENELLVQSTKMMSKVRQTFFSFIDLATNSELKANLSADLIPELNGRPLFSPDTTSLFERTLMDYAFRVALLSVLANMTSTKPSLVLETPDEVADESYIPYIANAFSVFSKDISIIITTYNSILTNLILKNYQKNERGRHFTDLVSKGTLTQRKYYEPNIAGFSGSP